MDVSSVAERLPLDVNWRRRKWHAGAVEPVGAFDPINSSRLALRA